MILAGVAPPGTGVWRWTHFSLYLINASRCFHVKFRWEWIEFTRFVSYCAYNVFYLTFRRNLYILIERKILEAISTKNSGLTMPQRTDGNKTNDHMAVHHAAQLCSSHRGPRTAMHMAVHLPICTVSLIFGFFILISLHILREALCGVPLRTNYG